MDGCKVLGHRRHRVRNLGKLTPGREVWITDTKVQGTVASALPTPRADLIDVVHMIARRNWHNLVPMQMTESDTGGSRALDQLLEVAPASPASTPASRLVTPTTIRTRSGRKIIIKPQRLDL